MVRIQLVVRDVIFCEPFNLTLSISVTAGSVIEPPHDKTNKVTVRPAKTQISQGIRPV